jgi:hypothetical protein
MKSIDAILHSTGHLLLCVSDRCPDLPAGRSGEAARQECNGRPRGQLCHRVRRYGCKYRGLVMTVKKYESGPKLSCTSSWSLSCLLLWVKVQHE